MEGRICGHVYKQSALTSNKRNVFCNLKTLQLLDREGPNSKQVSRLLRALAT